MRKVIISICVWQLLACNNHPAAPAKPVQISNGGTAIAYTDTGKGDTTLLFIHGWCINKEYWQPQVEFFRGRYRVVTLDLPGFGASGKNRANWRFEDYTEDIKTVIKTLGLTHVILAGHSMSGDIVLDAANKYPELLAGIVGVDNLHEPAGPFNDTVKRESAVFFDMLANAFDSTVTNLMQPGLFHASTNTAVVQRVLKDVFSSDSLIAVKVLKALADISQQEKKQMQGLQHRLYLVNSDVNPVNADSLKKYCARGFHVETVPVTGHYPMIEKPLLFNQALQRAIDRMGQKAGE
jgi:pimeloyl-ACP methyl ester carboxylesterase